MDQRRAVYALLYLVEFEAFPLTALFVLWGWISFAAGVVVMTVVLPAIAITISSQQMPREYLSRIGECELDESSLILKRKLRLGRTERRALPLSEIVMVSNEYMPRGREHLVLGLHNRDHIRIVGEKGGEGNEKIEALFTRIVKSVVSPAVCQANPNPPSHERVIQPENNGAPAK